MASGAGVVEGQPRLDRRRNGGWDALLAAEPHRVEPGGEWRSALWAAGVAQFTRAADAIQLDPELRTRLVEPRRALAVNFPVRMDDGTVRTFSGYRVQHTLTLGPTKGGIR